MPALGNRGPIAPRELAKAKAAPSKPIAKMPGTPTKAAPVARANAGNIPVLKPAPSAPVLPRMVREVSSPRNLQRAAAEAKMGPVLPGMLKQVAGLQNLQRASREAAPKGHGGGFLATITSPVKLAGAIVSDVPQELHGKGFFTHTLPAVVGNVETKGYENLGVGSRVAHIVGNGLRNVFEIPAQVLPAAYVAAKAVKELQTPGHEGKAGSEIAAMGKSFAKESALAHLAKGDVKGALSAAERNPGFAALELGGGLAAADRTAGAAARAGALGPDLRAKARLAGAGATDISRQPQELLGNAREPLSPYSKQLSVRLRQGKADPTVRPGQSIVETLRGKSLAQRLVKHFDKQAGDIRAVQKHNTTEAVHGRMTALAGHQVKGTPLRVPIPGHQAVNPFARGLLADPKVLNAKGEPLYRDQLKGLIELHSRPVAGETNFERGVREANVAHYQALMDNARFYKDPHQAKAAAVKYARDMSKLEPELIRAKVITPQSARVAKLVDPFQFHFRGQKPLVEEQPILLSNGQQLLEAARAKDVAQTARRGSLVEVRRAQASGDKQALADALARHKNNVAIHKAADVKLKGLTPPTPMDSHWTPFSIETPGGLPGQRTHLSIDQVEKALREKHGVEPKEIGFVSNRPYVNPDSAYYKNGQDPARGGFWPQKFRSGTAFTKGLYDPSHEALVRQHASNQGIVDQVHASRMQASTYALTREHVAKLLEEKVGKLTPQAQIPVREMIAELRSGPTYFKAHSGTSAWTHAQRAIAEVQHLHPDLNLTPGRIASPYAPAEQLDAIAKHTVESINDRLDPNLWGQHLSSGERFPTDATLQHDAGTVGVYHKAVADRIREYDKQMGSAIGRLFRAPASFWRISNIALSPKHPLGLAQELGIRLAANNIGVMSRIQAHKAAEIWERAIAEPNFLKEHPEALYQYQTLQAKARGTVGHQALNLQEHVSGRQLATTAPGAAFKAFQTAADSPAGAPLRAARGVFRGYRAVTKSILKGQEKLLGHQAEMAGLGKHLNNEVKRLTGQSIPLLKAMDKHQEQIIRGQITNPDALAHTSRQLVDYFGEWNKASPSAKRILAVAPFWNWYVNSLKFLYHTMPMHHPIKTGLLTALESATAEQRRAMGQGHGAIERLEPAQQGGIPVGKGYVANQQYYTPQGAVNSPVETLASLFLPEIQDAYKAATGSNSFGETLENAKHEKVTAETERARYAALSLLESFFPPVRWGNAATGAKAGEQDPAGHALHIPPEVWKVIDPLKISKERTEKGPRGKSGGAQLPQITLPRVSVPTVKLPTIRVR